MENTIAIVLAAGKGTRMKSEKSKQVHKILGKEIVLRAVENAEKAGIDDIIAVVGYKKEQVQEVLKDKVKSKTSLKSDDEGTTPFFSIFSNFPSLVS